MRNASVGIAAALIFMMVMVVVVPALAQEKFTSNQGDILRINAILPGSFELVSPRLGGELCDGVGARITNGYLVIWGRCTHLEGTEGALYEGKGVLMGGGRLTGPIVLMLIVYGRSPMRFVMMPFAPKP